MNGFVKKCIGLLGKRKIKDDIKEEITVLATCLYNSAVSEMDVDIDVGTGVGVCVDVDVGTGVDTDPNKLFIINKFRENVKGKTIEDDSEKTKHCGREGHALETLMGIKHNSKNEPDILGYEMKKQSKKITFGDFSATEYLFSKNREHINIANDWKKDDHPVTRKEFINYFGTPNPLKNNRFSWSGNCVPKYGTWNSCGQCMTFNAEMDLCIFYLFEKDERAEKHAYPSFLKNGKIVIAVWKKTKLETHVNNKYGKKGFFICKKNNNVYDKICFGNPFDFNYFADHIKNKNIIFDSGMYDGNSRNYSQFRSTMGNFWETLITDEYS